MANLQKWAFVFGLCLGPLLLPAQIQRTFHQSFEIGDSAQIIRLSLPWSYEVVSWPNNNMLVETTIRLENGSEAILKHLMEAKRYHLESKSEGPQLSFVIPVDKIPPVQSPKGLVTELLTIRVFMPASFSQNGEHTWQRVAPPKQE